MNKKHTKGRKVKRRSTKANTKLEDTQSFAAFVSGCSFLDGRRWLNQYFEQNCQYVPCMYNILSVTKAQLPCGVVLELAIASRTHAAFEMHNSGVLSTADIRRDFKPFQHYDCCQTCHCGTYDGVQPAGVTVCQLQRYSRCEIFYNNVPAAVTKPLTWQHWNTGEWLAMLLKVRQDGQNQSRMVARSQLFEAIARSVRSRIIALHKQAYQYLTCRSLN